MILVTPHPARLGAELAGRYGGPMERGSPAAAQTLRRVLAGHAAVAEGLAEVHEAAWAAIDPDLLELCRLRIAMLLGDDAELAAHNLDDAVVRALPAWPSSPLFSPAQRACLAFTEQFVIDVAAMDDALVDGVTAELGGDGLSSFVNALLVIEQRQRLHLIWGRLLPEVVA
jgi:alkylhydroperoxidase family enzyme